MQAPHLDVRQAGSHFGNTNAFHSQILQGNFHGLIINPTAASQTPLRTFQGHYAHSFLRPTATYVPRPQLHRKIQAQLHDLIDDSVEDVRILVVWGLGGAGKSQLVLNYIQEHREDYRAVFWIETGSKETIERDYVQIYRLLYDRQAGNGQEIVEVKDAVLAVKRWFQGQAGSWLMVLDSADAIDNDHKSYIDLGHFIPDVAGMHVIITSRSETAKEMTQLEAVEVAEMEASEATELFKRSAKMTMAGPDETREIGEIVKELGYLALAITLAGSYVSVTPRLSSDLGQYLAEYRHRRKALLQRRPQLHVHRYGESVMSTWEASFEAIEDYHPAAARLLSLLAFVSFEDISTSLFRTDGPEDLARNITDARNGRGAGAITWRNQTWRSFLFNGQRWTVYELEAAFETLQRYSLVQWRPDQGSYSMHKLVHAWGQDRLDGDRQRQLSVFSLELMADATAQDEIDPSHRLRLVPHVMASFRALTQLNKTVGEATQEVLTIVVRIENFLYQMGRWSEAYELRRFHLGKVKMTLGGEHPETLTSMHNLAQVLKKQGNYNEAERIYRQVLALSETVLGKEHPDTLTSMHNLAQVLSRQGNYNEAERIHRQVLALSESVLGKEYPNTLTSMHNLAQVFSKQGNYNEAERIYRQVLALKETVLGKEHPETLASMHNLAQVFSKQGNYNEAERIHRQVLALRERVSGKEHPYTLTSMHNLAQVLSRQGNYNEAERIHRQVLAFRERVSGKEHPDILTSMNNLAQVLRRQGNYNEAERIYRQVLALSESVLGKEHPETLTSAYCLAYLLHQNKQYKDAEPLYDRACAGYRKTLGDSHPTSTVCLRHYSRMREEENSNR